MSTLTAAPETLPLAPVVLADSHEMPRKRWTRGDVRRTLEQGLIQSF